MDLKIHDTKVSMQTYLKPEIPFGSANYHAFVGSVQSYENMRQLSVFVQKRGELWFGIRQCFDDDHLGARRGLLEYSKKMGPEVIFRTSGGKRYKRVV